MGQVVAGDVGTVRLSQMFGEGRLETGKTYLLLFWNRPADLADAYEAIGSQGVFFWIEDGELCGNDPRPGENDTMAQTAYFAARVAALG